MPLRTTILHLIIHGRVQGVFFRDSMRREAERMAVTGWVRNLDDGTVEAMVQGDADAVEAILQWARHGPPHAQVQHVVAEAGGGDFATFDILY